MFRCSEVGVPPRKSYIDLLPFSLSGFCPDLLGVYETGGKKGGIDEGREVALGLDPQDL